MCRTIQIQGRGLSVRGDYWNYHWFELNWVFDLEKLPCWMPLRRLQLSRCYYNNDLGGNNYNSINDDESSTYAEYIQFKKCSNGYRIQWWVRFHHSFSLLRVFRWLRWRLELRVWFGHWSRNILRSLIRWRDVGFRWDLWNAAGVILTCFLRYAKMPF